MKDLKFTIKSKIYIFFTVLCISTNLLFTFAQTEKIKDFNVTYKINQNGTIEVLEEITVITNQQQFKRGVYRDFIQNKLPGNLRNQQYQSISAEINGIESKISSEVNNENIRFYIGDPEIVLEPGEYKFTFKYIAKNSESYFKDHEEIFWNVNGEWSVKTERLRGVFILPEGIDTPQVKLNGFEGKFGSKNRFTNYRIEGNKVYFESDKILQENENISIAIWFPLNTFNGNSEFLKFGNYFKIFFLSLINLVSIFIVFFVFKNNGADSKILNAPVNFEIPKGVSPSIFRFLYLRVIDNKSLSCEIINLAIKKIIKIEKVERPGLLGFGKFDEFKFHQLSQEELENSSERQVINSFFTSTTKTVSTFEDSSKLDKAITKIGEMISDNTKGTWDKEKNKFVPPRIFFVIIYCLIILFSGFYMGINGFEELSQIFIVSFFGILIFAVIHKEQIIRIKLYPCFSTYFFFILSLVMLIVYFITIVPGPNYKFLILLSFAPLLIFELINSFDYLKPKDIETLVAIMGFKKFAESQQNYLKNVEKEIPLTLNMYEKFLPFALAIGIETLWSHKFSNVLASSQNEMVGDDYLAIYSYTSIENAISRNTTNYSSNGGGISGGGGFSGSGSSGRGGGSAGGGGW